MVVVRVQVPVAVEVFIATIIGVTYSMILLITFLVAIQAVAEIVQWTRTEARGVI